MSRPTAADAAVRFNHQILKEYLQTHHLMSIFSWPDLTWDYGAWWTQRERGNFNDVFNDIVIYGMHQLTWGSFVEQQWFTQQEYEDCRPSDIPWESD